MTNNDDIDAPEKFEKEEVEKQSFKEIWDSNPMLKLGAVVLAGAILYGGYLIVFPKVEETERSVVRVNSDIKQAPGAKELDPAVRKATEEANKKAAEIAKLTGTSALPTPIGKSTGGISLPDMMAEKPQNDVLSEWRAATDASRRKALKDAAAEEENGAAPDVVPSVHPVRPQVVLKQDPNIKQNLIAQMRVIIGAQAPVSSKTLSITKESSYYTKQKKEEEEVKKKQQLADAGGSKTGGKDSKSDAQTIVPAGTIAYAQLLTELNSDVKGPVLAQILSGPFEGGRALGKLAVEEEYMTITFNHVVKDSVSYKIEGIALDENTTLAGQATDVDHHYFSRIILPAAAKFIEGYSKAVSTPETTVTQTSGGGQASNTPKADATESIYKGVEESAKTVSEMLKKGGDRAVTVKIAKGTTMGVLFMDTVTTKDVEK